MTDISFNELTAIIVDDQEFVRTIVSKILAQFGFREVLTAADGGAALTTVLARKPDVIICDIVMKPVDGLEFLKRYRNEVPDESLRAPVIFMTGDMDQETVLKAHALGVEALVLKPVPPKKLREKIVQLLSKRQEGKEGEEEAEG
ncbi:MAG: response regulator [Alphaproteobacteria bacterium]|nr:response regulator [Alphaproteobacteria bacterium]